MPGRVKRSGSARYDGYRTACRSRVLRAGGAVGLLVATRIVGGDNNRAIVVTDAVGLAKRVESRTEAIENSRRRLVYEIVLSADDVTIGFEETESSEPRKRN